MSENSADLTDARPLPPKRLDRPYLDVVLLPAPLPAIPKHPPLPMAPRRSVNVSIALSCVAVSFSTTAAEMISKDRHRGPVEARAVAAWILRTLGGLSFPELGRAMGSRDHTSMMVAFRKCLRMREESLDFEAYTDELAKAVGARMETESGTFSHPTPSAI